MLHLLPVRYRAGRNNFPWGFPTHFECSSSPRFLPPPIFSSQNRARAFQPFLERSDIDRCGRNARRRGHCCCEARRFARRHALHRRAQRAAGHARSRNAAACNQQVFHRFWHQNAIRNVEPPMVPSGR